MKLLNRIQIVGKRIIEKVFKVDNIEKLEAQEEKMTAVLNTSKAQLNQLKAEIEEKSILRKMKMSN